MNFIPRNPWELDMAQWHCLAAENQFREEQKEERNKADAINNIINNFSM